MKVAVLGSAAGGGFPQWNSNAAGCQRARAGDPSAPPRTQACLAVSSDGDLWYLINASPDLREQIGRSAFLHPRTGLRSSPIAGVVLTGGDVDAIAGLLNLRERQPLTLLATTKTLAILAANPIFDVLSAQVVSRQTVRLGDPVSLGPDLTLELFAVPGKVPLYLETDGTPAIEIGETTVAAAITHGQRTLVYVPGCAAMTDDLAQRVSQADLVFFDGTLWRDDEMIVQGVGSKTGLRMGHMSLCGPAGTLAAFENLPVKRKILIHLNNSNPVLLADSAERAQVQAQGWEVAFDGMEIML